MSRKSPKASSSRNWLRRFKQQRTRAAQRGIEFLLTFEQWYRIWEKSGHINERGCHRGQYNMARFGDTGAYAIDNVAIIRHEQNVKAVVFSNSRRRNYAELLRGKPSRNRKLKNEEVATIKTEYRRYSKTHGTPALAIKYGVDHVTIWEAIKGHGWA